MDFIQRCYLSLVPGPLAHQLYVLARDNVILRNAFPEEYSRRTTWQIYKAARDDPQVAVALRDKNSALLHERIPEPRRELPHARQENGRYCFRKYKTAFDAASTDLIMYGICYGYAALNFKNDHPIAGAVCLMTGMTLRTGMHAIATWARSQQKRELSRLEEIIS